MSLSDYFQEESPYRQSGVAYDFEHEDVARRLKLVTRHLPKLKRAPLVALNMAQLPVADDELVRSVRRSSEFGWGRETAGNLRSTTPEQQRKAWKKMGRNEREVLKAVGYALPEEDDGGGGFLGIPNVTSWPGITTAGDVFGAVKGVGRAVRGPEAEAIGKTAKGDIPGISQVARAAEATSAGITSGAADIAKQGAQWLGTAGGLPGHVYRFQQALYEAPQGDPDFEDSLSSWSNLWEETGRKGGEGYFPLAVHEKVAAIMPDSEAKQRWAKRLASGEQPADIAARYAKQGTNQYEAIYTQVIEASRETNFRQAMKVLETGKVSPGRDVARGFGLQNGSAPYTAISGGVDLYTTIMLDPTLIAGKALKLYKGATRGISLLGEEGTVEQAIQMLRAREGIKLASTYGDDWASVIADPATPIRDIVRNGGLTHAWAERTSRAFRAGPLVDDAGTVLDPALANLMDEVPSLRRSLPRLVTEDIKLKQVNIAEEVKNLGRELTEAERDAISGFDDMDNVWDFLESEAGAKALTEGEFGGFTREHFEMPRLTRRGLFSARAKIKMEKAIDFAAEEGVRTETALGVDEVFSPTTGKVITVAEAENSWVIPGIPGTYATQEEATRLAARANADIGSVYNLADEPAADTVRLYQVRLNDETGGAVLPEHIHKGSAEKLGYRNWWTDDLTHARASAKARGPTGTLYVLDAPRSALSDIPETMAAAPGHEFHIADDLLDARRVKLGTVGDWVVVNKTVLPTSLHQILAPPAKLIRAATHRVPEAAFISTFGANFGVEMERLLDMGLDSASKRMWMHELLSAPSTELRRNIMNSAFDNMFQVNGVYETEGGIEFAQRFLNRTAQGYAMNGEDLMFIGGTSMRQGIMPWADHANAMSVPTFRDVMAQSQRASFTKRMFGGINSSQVESFMGTYWKPAVLLRLGFIPRAAGEELLSTVLRYPDLIKNQWLLRPLVVNEGMPLWFMQPMKYASNFMRHFLPDASGTWFEGWTDYILNRSQEWVRGMAAKAMDPKQLAAARAFARHPYLHDAYTKELAHVSGQHNMLASPIPGEEDLWLMPMNREGTEFARVLRTTSDREDYLRNHPSFRGTLAHETDRTIARDEFGRVAALSGGVYAHADDLDELSRQVSRISPGFADELTELMGSPSSDRLLKVLRDAVDDDYLRRLLNEYEDVKRTLDHDPKELARILKTMGNTAESPGGKIIAGMWKDLTPQTRELILVNERQVLAHLGALDDVYGLERAVMELPAKADDAERFYFSSFQHPADMDPALLENANIYDNPTDALATTYDGTEATAGFNLYYVDVDASMMVDQVPGEESLGLMDFDATLFTNVRQVPHFTVASPLDETKATRVRNLMDRARNTDIAARDELQHMSVRQMQDNWMARPDQARYIRENSRAYMTSDGRTVERPLIEGHARMYTLLATPEGMASLGKVDPAVAKELVTMRLAPGEYARTASDAATHGMPAYQPVSRYATTQRDEMEQVLRSVGGDRPDQFAVGFTDVRDARLRPAEVPAQGLGDTELWGVEPVPPESTLLRPDDAEAGRVATTGVPEALDDWAAKIRNKVNQMTTSPEDGRFLHELGGKAARRGEYTLDDLEGHSIGPMHLPEGINGPKFYTEVPNLWDRTVANGFGFINKAIGAIAREPLFFRNFTRRYELGNATLRRFYEDTEAAADMLHLASSVQGRQDDVLRTYRQMFEALQDDSPKLANASSWIGGEDEVALRAFLETADVKGIKPALLDEVKRHWLSMSGDDVATMRRWVENQRLVDTNITNSALSGAVADTIPFIDDHKVRSQMADMGRNLAPFFFAEEQFLKRWARVLVHSPEALRRAQLGYMGLQHAGVIRQNEYGDDVWVMPGSAILQETLGRTVEAITGEPYTIPVSVPFTGSVKYSLPGFNRVGLPSFSPMVGIPMSLMARRFPELNDLNEDLLGEQAVGRSVIDQILPASVLRTYHAIFDDSTKSAQYSSAMIQTMAWMDANGHAPGPDADPHEIDEFIDRAENWTRINLINRAIFGFVAPAAPQMEVPGNLSPELQKHLKSLPFEEAIAQFMKDNPDATAYTVFQSSSPSGASMPTTEKVGKLLDNNVEFVERHMSAVPWMLPQSGDDPTSRSVYAKQVKMGLRERKSPREWIEDLAFSTAAPEYFESRDSYDKTRLKYENNPQAKANLDASWAEWKAKFFLMHPLFEEQIGSRDAHNRRMRVLDDTRSALEDPDLPEEIEHVDELRTLVDSWYSYSTKLTSLSGNRSSAAERQRKNLRISFIQWGRDFTEQNKSVLSYWQRNIEPELGIDAALEQDLEAVR